MPIVGSAKKVLKAMKKQYGDKKGTNVFYATANKQDRKPETWKKQAAALLKHALKKNAQIGIPVDLPPRSVPLPADQQPVDGAAPQGARFEFNPSQQTLDGMKSQAAMRAKPKPVPAQIPTISPYDDAALLARGKELRATKPKADDVVPGVK